MSNDDTVCLVTSRHNELTHIVKLLSDSRFALRTYSKGHTFLEGIKSVEIKCALVDLLLPDMGGIDVLEKLSETAHDFPVLMVQTSPDVELASCAMRLGAAGVIGKPFTRTTLLQAIELALENGRADMSSEEEMTVQKAKQISKLTIREREVLTLLAYGYQNKLIAHKLGISERTVEQHRARIMRRLNVKSLANLVRLAIDHKSIVSEGAVRDRFPQNPPG